MTLVAIRHLPTSWNLAGRLQGRADIGIVQPDPNGQKRIEENRKKLLAQGHFDKVFCSTLRRTAETAAIYGHKNPICELLLDELDFGKYEGVRRKQFLAEKGDAWTNSPQTLKLGESISDFEKRIRQFLEKYKQEQRILVFGHGAWCRGIKSIHATGQINGMNQLTVENNEILVLDFSEFMLRTV